MIWGEEIGQINLENVDKLWANKWKKYIYFGEEKEGLWWQSEKYQENSGKWS